MHKSVFKKTLQNLVLTQQQQNSQTLNVVYNSYFVLDKTLKGICGVRLDNQKFFMHQIIIGPNI